MDKSFPVQKITITALLIAIGVIIPIFSPVKFILEPASFTFASHVAIFLSMFISPAVALIVSTGTALGFLLGGFPIVVVLRALSHIVFALIGAFAIRARPRIFSSTAKTQLFSFSIGLVHAFCEIFVVSIFYFNKSMTSLYYDNGFLFSVMLLVGVGTLVHSMIDFAITLFILRIFSQNPSLSEIFSLHKEKSVI